MKNIFIITLLLVCAVSGVFAQKDEKKVDKVPVKSQADSVKADKDALDLAKAAITAHGGEKFTSMKTLIVSGPVDITTSSFSQAIPATFVMIFSGNKYRFEINNPFTPFKQVFDGRDTSSTINGFNLPPLNQQGFPLLAKVGEEKFVVSALPKEKSKKKGFRVVSPEGFYTDYYINEKTNQVKGYEASYDIDGRSVTTSVEIDTYRTVDGVIMPEKYAQRFDVGQMTIYASFKPKDISVNKEVKDDVFTLTSK